MKNSASTFPTTITERGIPMSENDEQFTRAFERAERKQQRFYPGDDEMLAILYQEELEGLFFSNYLMTKGRSK